MLTWRNHFVARFILNLLIGVDGILLIVVSKAKIELDKCREKKSKQQSLVKWSIKRESLITSTYIDASTSIVGLGNATAYQVVLNAKFFTLVSDDSLHVTAELFAFVPLSEKKKERIPSK